MQPSTLAKRIWPLLLFVIAFYLYGLGYMPLVGPDEPRYAQVAREMFLQHDLITPTLGGHTWFEKPVLLYWSMIAGYRMFGVSEWSARLGPAIAGVLTILAIFWISSRIERTTEAPGYSILSTLVIASSAGLIAFSRAASFDIIVTMTLTWALCFFLAYEIEQEHREWFLAGFYCLVGLSLLAKGLIGVVLPAGIVGSYYLLRWRRPERKLLLSLVWGLSLTIAIAALWYAPVIARHGWPFIDEFFIQHHFARYLSNKYQHPQPVYYYIPVMLLLAMPWTLFLIDALIKTKSWNRRAENPQHKARIFILSWFVVPILFFSFSGSKLPAYILPSLSAAALLVGEHLASLIDRKESTVVMRVTGLLCLVMAAATLIFAQQTDKLSWQRALLVVLPGILAGGFILLRGSDRLGAVISLAVAPVLISILALNLAVKDIAAGESARDLINRADAEGYAGARLLMFSRIERTAEFYGSGRVVYAANGDPLRVESRDEVIAQLPGGNEPILMIVPVGYLPKLEIIPEVQTRLIAGNGRDEIVAVKRK